MRESARLFSALVALLILAFAAEGRAAALQLIEPVIAGSVNTGAVGQVGVTLEIPSGFNGTFTDDWPGFTNSTFFGVLALPEETVGDAIDIGFDNGSRGTVTITLHESIENPIFFISDIDAIGASVTVKAGRSRFTGNPDGEWSGDTFTAIQNVTVGAFGAVQYVGSFTGDSVFTFFWNYTQSNSGFELVSLGIGTPPVCGDLDMDGIIDATDLQRGREHLVGATLSGPFFPDRCNLIGPSDGGVTDCDVADMAVLAQVVAGKRAAASDLCAAAP